MAAQHDWYGPQRDQRTASNGMKSKDPMLTGRGWHTDARVSSKPIKVQIKNGNSFKNKLIGSN